MCFDCEFAIFGNNVLLLIASESGKGENLLASCEYCSARLFATYKVRLLSLRHRGKQGRQIMERQGKLCAADACP